MSGWRDKSTKIGRRIGLVIGRFQPFHNGHAHIITRALEDNEFVVVVIGSSGHPKTIKNPWTHLQRTEMISAFARDMRIDSNRIQFVSVYDHSNDDDWILDIRTKLNRFVKDNDEVTIYGNEKDHSSYYLELFPDWDLVEVPLYGNGKINATDFREKLFEDKEDLYQELPQSVVRYLQEWQKHDSFKELQREYQLIKKYKSQFEGLKHEPIFVTVNAFITIPGKVVLVRRKSEPGKGLLSLPGTFVDPIKTLKESLSDYINQTLLWVEDDCFVDHKVFDRPGRALRGRTIAHTFKIKPPRLHWPKIQSMKNIELMDLSKLEIYREVMYGDHAQMIKEMM